MIFYENRLLADRRFSCNISYFCQIFGKMSQNLSSAAVVIGALRENNTLIRTAWMNWLIWKFTVSIIPNRGFQLFGLFIFVYFATNTKTPECVQLSGVLSPRFIIQSGEQDIQIITSCVKIVIFFYPSINPFRSFN